MQVDINTNLKELQAELSSVREEAPQVFNRAVSEATVILYAACIRLLKSLIYNVTIPKRKNGKPKWRRTHQLLNAERMAVTVPYRAGDVEGKVFTDPSSPAWRYHVRRHNLKTRPAPWRTKATEQYSSRAIRKVRETVRDWRTS